MSYPFMQVAYMQQLVSERVYKTDPLSQGGKTEQLPSSW